MSMVSKNNFLIPYNITLIQRKIVDESRGEISELGSRCIGWIRLCALSQYGVNVGRNHYIVEMVEQE